MTYDPRNPRDRLYGSDDRGDRTVAWIIGTLVALGVVVTVVWALTDYRQTASTGSPSTTTGQSTDNHKSGSAPQTAPKPKAQ